jgi:ankyrin repeat protein
MIQDKNSQDGKKIVDAIEANDLRAVEELLSQGVDPNVKHDGFVALYYAIDGGNSDIIRLLLAHHADPFITLSYEEVAQYGKHLPPPAYFIIEKSNDSFLSSCLEGLDLSKIVDDNGNNFLHFVAIFKLRKSAIPVLVHQGLHPLIRNSDGLTAYHCAKLVQNKNVEHALKSFHSIIKYLDSQGNSVLHQAVKRGDKELVEFLLKAKADVNHPNAFYETPLFEAARHNNAEIAQLLIHHGARVNFSNFHDSTPLVYALTSNAYQCALLLLKKAAKPSLKSLYDEMHRWAGDSKSANQLVENLMIQCS